MRLVTWLGCTFSLLIITFWGEFSSSNPQKAKKKMFTSYSNNKRYTSYVNSKRYTSLILIIRRSQKEEVNQGKPRKAHKKRSNLSIYLVPCAKTYLPSVCLLQDRVCLLQDRVMVLGSRESFCCTYNIYRPVRRR